MKNKLAFISDVLFLGFIFFILSLVIFNFLLPYPFSIVNSGFISVIASLLFYLRQGAKRKSQLVNKLEQKELALLMSELNFSDRQEQNELIENALKKAGYLTERKKGAVFIKDKNAVIICRFSFAKVSKADVVRAYNLITKTQTAYILAESFDLELLSFAQRFDQRVVLVDGAKIYTFLKEHHSLPKNYKYKGFFEKKTKASFKPLLDRKKSKTFFVFGLLLLLFSYISPLKLYYIVCGCVFLIYSLVLRLLGKDFNLNIEKVDNI